MNLVIDAGNTIVKIAVFQEGEIQIEERVSYKVLSRKIETFIKKFAIDNVIVSSVGKLHKEDLAVLEKKYELLWLSHKISVPFFNKYATPNTLGMDRVALIAAAVHSFPKKEVLVIDVGTCVTYDFKNDKEEYLGGAIAPGMQMRFKALNSQTAKLPLLDKTGDVQLIGDSTENSIRSGVICGICSEIDGIIDQYLLKFPQLTVILTGGDTLFLSKRLKNTIFAHSNFLLQGLNYILEFNKSK